MNPSSSAAGPENKDEKGNPADLNKPAAEVTEAEKLKEEEAKKEKNFANKPLEYVT